MLESMGGLDVPTRRHCPLGEMAMEAHGTTTGNRQHRGQGLGVEGLEQLIEIQGSQAGMAHRTG